METFLYYWPWLTASVLFIAHLLASVHVLLSRRDAASSIAWIGVIWLAPLLGPVLYFLLGINRIQRRAKRLRGRQPPAKPLPSPAETPPPEQVFSLAPEAAHLAHLVKLVATITERPLLPGNRFQPLYNGEEAYPAMLEAIRAAKQSVGLSTYIFNLDSAGASFVETLRLTVARGIDVRVLIDDIGGHYTWHPAFGALRSAGVPVASFLPKRLPRYFPYANLCNHRKLLIVDGQVGFTGGMNISEDHCVRLLQRHPMGDVHFQVGGPVVAQLQEVFADDWEFATGEPLQGERWFPDLAESGPVLARGISSGPDADLEKLHLIYCGALACARSRVRIVSPYFLPDPSLISALSIAALRGVQVDILVPRDCDLHLLQWAATGPLYDVLEYGCKVWLTPPPFSHTKLMLVDGHWTLLGSGNWDPRSLRLNFEFDVECYDRDLTAALESVVAHTLEQSQPLTLADLNNRSFPVRLRDGLARLLTPYL